MESKLVVNGEVLDETILAAGRPWGRLVGKGERLRFVDLEGKQAVDFLCYDAADPSDRYNAGNTMKMQSNILIGYGSVLWSDRGKRMMRVTCDSCGYHDTIGGCCSAEMNLVRYADAGPGNCRDTFADALRPFGLGRGDIVANINWFMHVPVGPDGHMAIAEGISKPGDFVEVEAERDLICVASNCTQIFNPSNGGNPTPVQILTYRPAPGA